MGIYQKRKVKKRKVRQWVPVAIAILLLLFLGKRLLPWFTREVYPLPYKSLIVEAAHQHKNDPALLAAMIKVESNFRPDAVSEAGAKGLMQLMPNTAQWIAKETNSSEFTLEKLTDPKTNIDFGSWYLRYLLENNGHDESRALAAYNAGDAGAGYQETRSYVKHVLKAKEVYKKLYPELQ